MIEWPEYLTLIGLFSGLPPSDGDHHVTNIAGLALNIQARWPKYFFILRFLFSSIFSSLLSSNYSSLWSSLIINKQLFNVQANINKFVVSHRPYERLKLRAGINTGPIIAGVQSVGIKMPRWGYIWLRTMVILLVQICVFGSALWYFWFKSTYFALLYNTFGSNLHIWLCTMVLLVQIYIFDLEL